MGGDVRRSWMGVEARQTMIYTPTESGGRHRTKKCTIKLTQKFDKYLNKDKYDN